MIGSRNLHPMHSHQPNANKDIVKLIFQLRQRSLSVDLHAKLKLHPKLTNQLNLAQAIGQRQLVLRHSIGIQTTGQGPLVEDRHLKSPLLQLSRSTQATSPCPKTPNPPPHPPTSLPPH